MAKLEFCAFSTNKARDKPEDTAEIYKSWTKDPDKEILFPPACTFISLWQSGRSINLSIYTGQRTEKILQEHQLSNVCVLKQTWTPTISLHCLCAMTFVLKRPKNKGTEAQSLVAILDGEETVEFKTSGKAGYVLVCRTSEGAPWSDGRCCSPWQHSCV